MKGILFITTLLLFSNIQLRAQIDIQALIQYCDSSMNAGIEYPMIPGAVMGLGNSDSIFLLKGYGHGDYEKKTVVDPYQTLFQLGSVGKIMTSIAFLQQVDAGKIALDDDINAYLDGWKLDNPFDQFVTPFHLLTHTAGFNDQFIGYMAPANAEVETLGEHLPKRMPGVFKSPGTEINYSNYGYALAGHLVERLGGETFENYVQSRIFEPLKMTSASYYLPDDYLEQTQYANGYLWRETFVETKMFPRHAKPAGSVVSTGIDMIRLGQALLRRDSLLLSQASYDLLLKQQFSNHPRLTGYTLGLEVQNLNGYRALAKGGQVTGFLSVLMLFPKDDVVLILSTNTETDNHFEQFFRGLMDRFFPAQTSNDFSLDYDPDEYIGHYTNERVNHETLEEFFGLFMGHFEIFETDSGKISTYHNGGWHTYNYLGEDVFQDIEIPDLYLVFKRNEAGKVDALYRSVNVGGVQIPASYRKLGFFERPRFLNDEYPYALTFMATYLLLPLFWLARRFIPRKQPTFLQSQKVNFYYHAVAFLFLALFIWNIMGFFVPLIKLGEQIALGLPTALLNMKYVNWVMGLCSVVLLLLSLQLWIQRKGSIWFKIYYSIFSLISFSYILILYRWHFFSIDV